MKLVIHSYSKPGDSVTLNFDDNGKQLQGISIVSHRHNPPDVLNLMVTFGRLPDRTNPVATTTLDGVSKQLTVNTSNSDYRAL
jgi:hypothetical protein